jgi:hypothetical protein
MRRHPVADPRELFQFLWILNKLLDGLRKPIDKLRGLLIAAVAPDDGAINFQELRRLAQDAGNLFVVQGGLIISPISSRR